MIAHLTRAALIGAALALSATAASAYDPRSECDPEFGPYYGDPAFLPPPRRSPYDRRPVRPCTPIGAVTPPGEIAYPLKPGNIQTPPEMGRHAFPRGIPPGWYR